MAQQLQARPPALPRKLPPIRFGQTSRKDAWWLQPLTVFLVFSAFVVYATWAGIQGENYYFGNYLSPFYSPELFGEGPHALFGPQPAWWPAFLPFSPAFLILWAPVGFRFTCYYYRGAYYKAFWADPVSCAVGEPRKGYLGERHFPLIIQNIHRYFLPFALALIAFLSYDAWKALWFTDPATGATEFGVGVGSIVLALNAVLLGGYTLGCHSLRHIVGGRLVQISRKPMQYKAWRGVSFLNRNHMAWAWCSLFWVGFSDVYVRMLAMGVWTDWRIF
jgi:hypothetical protein